MSDVITFDTQKQVEDRLLVPAQKQQPKIFDLVPETHPLLQQKLPDFDFTNPPVNPNEFASILVETCKAHNGYGLSANQCGFNHRVFVMGAGDNYVAFFNPVLLETSKEEAHIIEGCLSFPFLGLKITRPASIVVEYQDFVGEKHTTRFEGISARCWLHELDHMNGIVYTKKAKPLALKTGLAKRKKAIDQIKKNLAQNRAGQLLSQKK